MMGKAAEASGICCLPPAGGLIYVRVGPDRRPVGIVNLEMVFRQLLLLEHSQEAVCNAELLAMARRFNYIPRNSRVEAEFATALRSAYAHYCARQKPVKQVPSMANRG
jgi:hypothetical protein